MFSKRESRRVRLGHIVRLVAVMMALGGMAAGDVGDDERQASMRTLATLDARVAGVIHRLATANVAMCNTPVTVPGWVIQDIAQFPRSSWDDARAVFGFPTPVAVELVVPGGGAAQAGVRAGDGLVAVDGTVIAPLLASDDGPQGKTFDRMARVEAAVVAAFGDGRAELTLLRDGTERTVMVTGTRACPATAQVIPGTTLQAEADGWYVQVKSALVSFTRSDDELAAVLAHELAHNVLRHRAWLEKAGANHGVFRGVGKSGRLWRQSEDEADRLSVYLMVNAGYDPAAAVSFWDRFGKRSASGIFSDGTHSGWKKRRAMISATIGEVTSAPREGATIVPGFVRGR